MDVNLQLSSLVILAGSITTLGGAWLTIRKINNLHKKERETEAAKILQEAKENDNKIKAALESRREISYNELDAKIDSLKVRLENLEDNVSKDFAHVRETYNGEIRNLGNKIEDLRSELRDQHGNLVQLLTKMIDNRD